MRAAPGALGCYLVLTLAEGALPVATAWLTKLVLDNVVSGAALGTLIRLAAVLSVAGVVAAVAPHTVRYLRSELDRAVGLVAQDRLFTAVDRFVGLGRFENPEFLDRLRLAQQAGAATPNQAVEGVLGIVRAAIGIAGFLGSIYVLSPLMSVLVLASAVPTFMAELLLSRRRASTLWTIAPAERREFFYGQLLSSVTAAKEVRLFHIGGFLRHRMLAERRSANSAKRATDRQEVIIQAGLGLLAAVVAGAGLLWAVGAARSGRFSVGDITVFVAALAGVQGALATLAGEVARTHQALVMFEHYLAVTAAGPDLAVPATPRALPELRHAIELRDVWFRYSPDHPWVLRGVSLRIRQGTAVALVGLNGAGKSTLVKLLGRFYDPDKGRILWNGVDIREVDVTDLRRRMGAVFQDYMAYDMTAAENIGLGDLAAIGDPCRIEAAALRAGIHDKLTGLPHGYDTLLSRNFVSASETGDPETGVMLSGGQWQRLALARAFLRDRSELMILDEPSSGLDAEAEAEIHRSLTQHREARTSLLISHRLSAVREADLIVVLSEGRVVEQGDHTTLMAAGGEYARLFALQAAGYQATGDDGSPLLSRQT
ncbi:ABC transporter ATP-binding protein [Amycolatopsis pigmentata]|uniref:ABC transporter ATP-binding protein n=1 Tax=Amycolatopsis pigmentata TaxID=450801 RepID=A0ABW5FPL8_9PSEU